MKRKTTKAEQSHRKRVAELGCIVCRNLGNPGTPACLHHPRSFAGMGQRASEWEVIPLCPYHHQQGPFGHAIHNGSHEFAKNYGTEEQLLEQVLDLL